MQRVDFFCDECNVTIEIEYTLKEGPPKHVPCPGCGKAMRRLFGSTAVHIPEWFGDHNHNTISNHMKNAPLPSGRDKALY